MSKLDNLVQQFEKFPGVGARQARRFAFHILTLPEADSKQLASLIDSIQGEVIECESCHRFFAKNGSKSTLCNICNSPNRDHNRLLVVERDSDVTAIERAGSYDGLYFVLGGTVPLLNSEDTKKLRAGALKATVETRLSQDLSEIILGFSINPDGENTMRFVESILEPLIQNSATTLTHLGRGLSTGSELEYADPDTIKNALQNRT
jgi:recombination protein RecR